MGHYKIENGEITTAKELLLDMCTSYGIKIVDGVIQYDKVGDFHKKLLNEATEDYIEFQMKTDKELQKYIDETFEKSNDEKQKSFDYYQAKAIKYDNIIQQLKLWKHTDSWNNMYNNLMGNLVKEYEFSTKMIKEYADKVYKKETLNEFKDNKTKYYLNKIKKYSDYCIKDIEDVEKNNKIIKEFEDSLNKLE